MVQLGLFWLNGSVRITFALAVAIVRAVAVAFRFGMTAGILCLFVWLEWVCINQAPIEPKTTSITTKASVRMILALADTLAMAPINRALLLRPACVKGTDAN